MAVLSICATTCNDGGMGTSPTDDTTGGGEPGLAESTPPETGGLRLEVRVRSPRVKLGEDVIFDVTLVNDGSDDVEANVPRIGANSLRFRVRRGTQVARLMRFYFDLEERTGRPIWKPNMLAELGPGDAVTQEIRTPAVQVGKVTFTPFYVWRGGDELSGPPIEVEVLPDGANGTVGVVMDTTLGSMTFRLRPDLAYTTVESFVSLAGKGFYDGTTFHRIARGFMAQGGDPNGNGTGGPGYYLPGEMHTHLLHERGVLSMARLGLPRIGKDTAGSQFFILFTRRPDLDKRPGSDGYTTFGELVEGDATLTALEAVEVAFDRPGGELSRPVEKIAIRKLRATTLP